MVTSSNPFPSASDPSPLNSPLSSSSSPSSMPSASNIDPMIDRAAQTAHEVVDKLANKAGPAIDRVRSGVSDAVGVLGEKVEGLSATKDEWMENCRHTVRENPLAAVGVSMVAGYLLARMLRD